MIARYDSIDNRKSIRHFLEIFISKKYVYSIVRGLNIIIVLFSIPATERGPLMDRWSHNGIFPLLNLAANVCCNEIRRKTAVYLNLYINL